VRPRPRRAGGSAPPLLHLLWDALAHAPLRRISTPEDEFRRPSSSSSSTMPSSGIMEKCPRRAARCFPSSLPPVLTGHVASLPPRTNWTRLVHRTGARACPCHALTRGLPVCRRGHRAAARRSAWGADAESRGAGARGGDRPSDPPAVGPRGRRAERAQDRALPRPAPPRPWPMGRLSRPSLPY